MRNKGPLVTIIIPSYNHEKYIEQAVRSVFEQTYESIEIIIIDDGSTDSSRSIIEGVISKYNGSKVIKYHVQSNAGLIKTLNKALTMANGECVGFLASDDAYLPTKIEKCVNILSNTTDSTAAVYTDGYLINSKGQKTGRFTDKYPRPILNNTYRELIVANWIPALGMLYKKSVFDDVGFFDESLYVEDYDMLLRVAKKYEIEHTSEKLFLYRWHDTNMSKQSDDMQKAFEAIAAKHSDLCGFNSFKSAIKNIKITTAIKNINMMNIDLLTRSVIRKVQMHSNIQGVSLCGLLSVMVKKYVSAKKSKLRAIYEKIFGLEIGRGSRVYGKIIIVGNKKNISVGNNVQFLGNTRIVVPYSYARNMIVVEDNTVIDNNVILFSLGGDLRIGKNCFIGPNCVIQSNGDVSVGDYTMIASGCSVYANNHRTDQVNLPYYRQGNRFDGIIIGQNCWFGTGVTVIDGSKIGDNTIVGANCVVRGNHNEYSVIVAKGLVGNDINRVTN